MQVFETEVLGQAIRAQVVRLDAGLDVGVYGGGRTHVGAVTLAETDGSCRTLLREGHRDDAVSERFAAALAVRFGVPVCVRCGIHYDGIGRAEIAAVLAACEGLLEQMLKSARTENGVWDRSLPPAVREAGRRSIGNRRERPRRDHASSPGRQPNVLSSSTKRQESQRSRRRQLRFR